MKPQLSDTIVTIKAQNKDTTSMDKLYKIIFTTLQSIKVKNNFPENLVWRTNTLNPEHGLYLKTHRIYESKKNYFINGFMEEYGPIFHKGEFIRNYLDIRLNILDEKYEFLFEFFEGDLDRLSIKERDWYISFIVPDKHQTIFDNLFYKQ